MPLFMGSLSTSEILDQSQDKQRIVIAGSSGTFEVATLILHVLRQLKRPCDYVLSRPPEGQTSSVHVSDAPVLIVDQPIADSVPLDWHHHIAVLTGFDAHATSEESLIRSFDAFADATPKSGILIYNESDRILTVICTKERPDVLYVPFKSHPHHEESGNTYLVAGSKERGPFSLSGKEPLLYVSAAKETLKKIGVTSELFYQALQGFRFR